MARGASSLARAMPGRVGVVARCLLIAAVSCLLSSEPVLAVPASKPTLHTGAGPHTVAYTRMHSGGAPGAAGSGAATPIPTPWWRRVLHITTLSETPRAFHDHFLAVRAMTRGDGAHVPSLSQPPSHSSSRVLKASSRCPAAPRSLVANHGGSLIAGGLNVYVILYGNWDSKDKACAPGLVGSLVYGLNLPGPGYSKTVGKWWQTVTKYCEAKSGRFISPMVNMMTIVKDSSYSAGRNLGTNVWKVVQNNIQKGIPMLYKPGANDFFLVLVSSDVQIGPRPSPCAWNSYGIDRWGTKVPFGVVAEPGGKRTACAPPNAILNKCKSIDQMASGILHVLANGATNPFGTGWHTKGGSKGIADLCAGKGYSTLSAAQGGSLAFQVQQVYDARREICVSQS